MNRVLISTIAILAAVSCWGVDEGPVIGGPCEGCELVFQGMPESIPPEARIAPADEPAQRMVIEGTVRHGDGVPGYRS